jgi:hypothetical protein
MKRTLSIIKNHLRIFVALALILTAAKVRADEAPRLSLDEARKYMLELINRDRAKENLPPVALDETASRAAQGHAEEMAQNIYLSHSNLAGKMPDQRYTEAGGADSVGENTYMWMWWSTPQPPVSLPLQEPEQTFAKSDLEAIEGAYIGEVPPLDGHRRQILNPYHTHVGIGLGRAFDGKAVCLANTQEFVQRYLQLETIPKTAKARDKIKIAGIANPEKPIYALAVGREDLPTPKTRDEVKRINSYRRPDAKDWAFAGRDFKVGKDGKFETTYSIPPDAPGVYHLMIWIRDDKTKTGTNGLFIASDRTIVVE